MLRCGLQVPLVNGSGAGIILWNGLKHHQPAKGNESLATLFELPGAAGDNYCKHCGRRHPRTVYPAALA